MCFFALSFFACILDRINSSLPMIKKLLILTHKGASTLYQYLDQDHNILKQGRRNKARVTFSYRGSKKYPPPPLSGNHLNSIWMWEALPCAWSHNCSCMDLWGADGYLVFASCNMDMTGEGP